MKTDEERQQKDAEKQQRREEREQERANRKFAESPAGQAAAAYAAGEQLFQIRLDDEHDSNVGGTVASIESQGWRLEHAGWAMHPTKGATNIASTWHMIGMYLFRRATPQH